MTILRDRRTEFEEAGVKVYPISRDHPWSHVAWAEVHSLGYPLLSDWNGDAVRAFGVAQELRGLHDVARRSAFLVDGEGMIRATWRYKNSEVPDFDELLSAARSLS